MDDFEDENFLDSEEWRERLKRTLLYPGNQTIDNTLPIQVSELCVNSFRSFAPRNESKLGLRVATRLTRNSCLNPSVVMMALIYLKRLQEQDPAYLQRVSSADLFVVSTMVASKFLFDDGTDDECYNDDWACGVGMELEKLNSLELEFLNALSWNVNVKKSDFDQQLLSIEADLSRLQMERTNLFTYNNARNINLSAPMYYVLCLISKVFVFSTFATFCFVKCLDKTSQLATELNYSTNTNTTSTTEIEHNVCNTTVEEVQSIPHFESYFEHEENEKVKVPAQKINLHHPKKPVINPCRHDLAPFERILSFNFSYCII